MIVEEEVYLAHYGVKGMRWGVRKKSGSSNSSESKKKNRRKTPNMSKKAQQRRVRGLAALTTAYVGYGAMTSPTLRAAAKSSVSAAARKINPSVDDLLMKNIRRNPIPMSFIDTNIAAGVPDVFRGGSQALEVLKR